MRERNHILAARMFAIGAVMAAIGFHPLPSLADPPEPSSAQAPEATNNAVEKSTEKIIAEGQVTDTIGLGLEGVEISIYKRNNDGGRGELLAKTTTNKYGDFAIKQESAVKGRCLVIFIKPKFAELVRELELAGDEPPFLGETLLGNLKLTGKVSSAADEKPVRAAKIELRTPGRDLHAETDESGRFEITGLSAGAAALIVVAQGFGRESLRLASVEDAGEQLIIIKPERIVRLLIRDDAGRLVDGVLIEALDQVRNDLKTTMSDLSGEATLKGVHFDAAALRLRLSRESYVGDTGFQRVIEMPKSEPSSQHDLVIQRAGSVSGRIVDSASGNPVYGARVMAGDVYEDESLRDWTDTDGRFTIKGLTPGAVTVTVHAAGHAPQLGSATVSAGNAAQLDLSMSEGIELRGTVKGADGKPVSGAQVYAASWRGKQTLGLRAIANENGEFMIEDAPEDEFAGVVTAYGFEDVHVKFNPGERVREILLTKGTADDEFSSGGGLKVGEPVLTLTLRDLQGTSLNLDELKGKVIVVDFWATWCAPCVVALPQIAKAYEKYKLSRDLVMIGISRDSDSEAVAKFLKVHPEYAWHQVVGKEAGAIEAAEKFRVTYIPALFIVGRDGKIAAAYIEAKELAERLQALLVGSDPPPAPDANK